MIPVDLNQIVWSKAADGLPSAHGGLVIDGGVTADGEPYVIVLDPHADDHYVAVRRKGQRTERNVQTVVCRRLFLADIDESRTEPTTETQQHGWAKKALVSAGVRGGYLGGDTADLLRLPLELLAGQGVREQ